jgi:hypothetical protein
LDELLIFSKLSAGKLFEMASFEHELPNDDELTVPEVNLSSASLRAGAFHMGKQCENQNNVSNSLFSPNKFAVYSLRNGLYFDSRSLCYAVRSCRILASAWPKDVQLLPVHSTSSAKSKSRASPNSRNIQIV